MICSAVLKEITGATSNSYGPDSDGPDFDGSGFDGSPYLSHSSHQADQLEVVI